MRKEIVAPFENKTQGREKTLGAYLEKITTLSFFSSKKSVTCYKNKVMPYLIPAFLRRLDHYLLIRYPLLWVNKAHYALFYSLLALGLGGLFVYLYPLTSESYLPTYEETLLVGALLVLPVTIYWVYLQVVYKVNSRQFRFFAYAQFALHFLCFSVFTFLPFAFAAMVNEKVANLVTYKELIEDINALNIGNHYFPTQNEGDTLWDDDRLIKVEVKMISEVSGYEKEYLIRGKDSIEFIDSRHFSRFTVSNSPKLDLDNDLFSRTDDYVARYATAKWMFLGTLKSEEYLKAWGFHVKKEGIKIQEINDYIKIYNKYTSKPIRASAKSILQQYFDKKVGKLITEDGKREIHDKMFSIFYATKTANFPTAGYFYVMVSFFLFSFSLLLFVFQRVNKLDFVLGVLIFIAYTSSIIFASGFLQYYVDVEPHDCSLDYSEDEIALFIFVSSALILHIFLLRLKKDKIHQHYIYASLTTITGSFFSYISLFFLIRGVISYSLRFFSWDMIVICEDIGSCAESNFILFRLPFIIALFLYFLFFIPFYHRLFTYLQSLPK